VELAALLVQELKGILDQAEMVGLELRIVAVEFHRNLGLHKVDVVAVKVTAAAVVVVVVEIGQLVTAVGNWHRIAGSFEAVKKVDIVEDSMRVVLVAVAPVGIAVSAAGSRVPLVGLRLPSVVVEVSEPNCGKQSEFAHKMRIKIPDAART
jgi:hypothetical protein